MELGPRINKAFECDLLENDFKYTFYNPFVPFYAGGSMLCFDSVLSELSLAAEPLPLGETETPFAPSSSTRIRVTKVDRFPFGYRRTQGALCWT
jgi:hypothetical protein